MVRQPMPAEVEQNPSRAAWIAGAVGAGFLVTAGVWWIWLRTPRPPRQPLGQVLCSPTAYFGPVAVDDYIVVLLGSTIDPNVQESTWAVVTAVNGTKIDATLVGETEGLSPKPLHTSLHGFSLGDKISLQRKCIVDRFRPGQTWRTVCGPSLITTGHVAISPAQASILGIGDRAQLVIRAETGETNTVWVTIDSVSQGVQSLRGLVGAVPSDTLGPKPGDAVEFLRDCVVDAEFGE